MLIESCFYFKNTKFDQETVSLLCAKTKSGAHKQQTWKFQTRKHFCRHLHSSLISMLPRHWWWHCHSARTWLVGLIFVGKAGAYPSIGLRRAHFVCRLMALLANLPSSPKAFVRVTWGFINSTLFSLLHTHEPNRLEFLFPARLFSQV